MRTHLKAALARGVTAEVKAFFRGLAAEIRVEGRDGITPVIGVPPEGFAYQEEW